MQLFFYILKYRKIHPPNTENNDWNTPRVDVLIKVDRWVPEMLSDEHERQRVEISKILLHRCQQEGYETVDGGPGGDYRARNKLLENLITGDETLLHLSTPGTKRDSMTWKHPSSPAIKKFKVQQPATK
ncbi:histone-lysine N-methyltransferase SETMAR [Elysia marginata]|uniref:Histone-lysine N-methyltransferase SETMAR n=1 Tax=Elysia marginata TaxID=1093978 RepID=A0AAV4H019_9GAST|nr:histone-lysine N-methyltransferase SETMAR [Elysia marginata]